jgi:hypothetical protein
MGRIIGSVVAGYVMMAVTVFILFSAGYLVLGTDGAYRPGSWDVSGAWIGLSLIVGVLAAMGGGCVCAAIARNPRGPQALIGVVIVLGLLMAIPTLLGSGDAAGVGPRPDTVGLLAAMQGARQPVWLTLVNPLLGAFGVLLGARLHSRGKAATD